MSLIVEVKRRTVAKPAGGSRRLRRVPTQAELGDL
jgi:hypothetical protein